jgi:hypothetical protein
VVARNSAVRSPRSAPLAARLDASIMVKTHRTHRDVDDATQARIDAIKTTPTLHAPPVPRRPALSSQMSAKQKLHAITRYIAAFEYNHTGVGDDRGRERAIRRSFDGTVPRARAPEKGWTLREMIARPLIGRDARKMTEIAKKPAKSGVAHPFAAQATTS